MPRQIYPGDIDFSDNSPAAGKTSQLLEWYEEGVWTPAISWVTPGDLSITFSDQNGHYVRIGALVFCQYYIGLSAITKGTAAGSLIVTGLPFTVHNTGGADRPSGSVITYNAPFGAYPLISPIGNTTTAHLLKIASDGAYVNLDDPDANSVYMGSFIYTV